MASIESSKQIAEQNAKSKKNLVRTAIWWFGKPQKFATLNVGARTPQIELYVLRESYFMFVSRVHLLRYKCDVVCTLFMLLDVTRGYSLLFV